MSGDRRKQDPSNGWGQTNTKQTQCGVYSTRKIQDGAECGNIIFNLFRKLTKIDLYDIPEELLIIETVVTIKLLK